MNETTTSLKKELEELNELIKMSNEIDDLKQRLKLQLNNNNKGIQHQIKKEIQEDEEGEEYNQIKLVQFNVGNSGGSATLLVKENEQKQINNNNERNYGFIITITSILVLIISIYSHYPWMSEATNYEYSLYIKYFFKLSDNILFSTFDDKQQQYCNFQSYNSKQFMRTNGIIMETTEISSLQERFYIKKLGRTAFSFTIQSVHFIGGYVHFIDEIGLTNSNSNSLILDKSSLYSKCSIFKFRPKEIINKESELILVFTIETCNGSLLQFNNNNKSITSTFSKDEPDTLISINCNIVK